MIFARTKDDAELQERIHEKKNEFVELTAIISQESTKKN